MLYIFYMLYRLFVYVPFQHGFVFHHTYPTYIVLTQWLPEDEPNTLPSFATSYLGMYYISPH